MNADAEFKLKRAKTQIILKNPFFGYLTLFLKMKKNENIVTIGVNKDFNLFYNDEFINKLNNEEVEGLLLHEVLHLALAHHFRAKNMNKIISNVAQDIIINNIISKSNFELPQNGFIPHNDSITITIFDKEIVINNISQKSFEMIYDEIMKQIEDIADNMCYDNSMCCDNENDNNESDESNDSDSETKDNDDVESDENSKANIKQKILDELAKRILDEHSDLDKMNEDERKELTEKVKQILIEAYENSKKSGIPAELLRIITDLTEPKLKWQQLLYLFVTNNLPSRYTYSRPSKRSYTLNVFLPKLLKEDVDIVICVDTSGSISDNELKEFFSEIQAIINSFDNIHAKVIFADCKVHEVVDFDKNTYINELINKCKGGGGTSHIPVFEYIESNFPNTRMIICFTDGYTDAPQYINIPAKVLWIITENGTDENVKHLGDVVWLK